MNGNKYFSAQAQLGADVMGQGSGTTSSLVATSLNASAQFLKEFRNRFHCADRSGKQYQF